MSVEAREDGDKRYPGNEVDSEYDDYDVMCLYKKHPEKLHHEKLLFHYFSCFCFWVRRRFCFVFLVWDFMFPFRDLSFCFGFWVFDFVCMLFFFRVFDVYFRILSVCFVYGYKGKLSVFYIV